MSYTLPKTDKRFLRDFGQRPTPFVHHHTCENRSYTQTITNPNAYSVEIVVSMQGGSGDSNRATYDSDRKYWDKNRYNIWRYTYAGRVGNTLTLSPHEAQILATHKDGFALLRARYLAGTLGSFAIQGGQYRRSGARC